MSRAKILLESIARTLSKIGTKELESMYNNNNGNESNPFIIEGEEYPNSYTLSKNSFVVKEGNGIKFYSFKRVTGGTTNIEFYLNVDEVKHLKNYLSEM